jgi:hypothetical protein
MVIYVTRLVTYLTIYYEGVEKIVFSASTQKPQEEERRDLLLPRLSVVCRQHLLLFFSSFEDYLL